MTGVQTCALPIFYKDAKLLRLTRYRYNDTPLDQNGRYYYIKDGDTVWVVKAVFRWPGNISLI